MFLNVVRQIQCILSNKEKLWLPMRQMSLERGNDVVRLPLLMLMKLFTNGFFLLDKGTFLFLDLCSKEKLAILLTGYSKHIIDGLILSRNVIMSSR